MSVDYYYQISTHALGEAVKVETADGTYYHAVIEDVDQNYLYLRSIETLAKLIINDHVDEEELKDTLLAIPLASIIDFNLVPFMFY